jgi:hypothetical protein
MHRPIGISKEQDPRCADTFSGLLDGQFIVTSS